MSLKGDWRWTKLPLILWLNLMLCLERDVTLLPSTRSVILPAMSKALCKGIPLGWGVSSVLVCFLRWFLVFPNSFFLYKLLCKLTLEQDFYVPFHVSVQFQWWEESFCLSLSDTKAFLFELWYRVELFSVEQGSWCTFHILSGNLLLLPSCPVLCVALGTVCTPAYMLWLLFPECRVLAGLQHANVWLMHLKWTFLWTFMFCSSKMAQS